ncbi:MAG: formate dehydrogenase accessory protein FdhE [Candidatus Aminicenantes bacterium]|nr:formate dehydrogenase accessory protein FdhE [Candidatus Aminicenantes bacterium]
MSRIRSEDALSVLYGREGISDPYIDFQIALSQITEKYKERCKSQKIVIPGQDTVRSKFESGAPLITFMPISLSLKNLTASFREIITAFRNFNVCSEEVFEWVKNQADAPFLKGIIESIFSFDLAALRDLSEPTPFDEPTLILVSRELVKPFFRFLAGLTAGTVPVEYWPEGYCPICGEAPGFARFSKEEEGKRYLWCEKCDLEWPFQRLCCPFCKNSDHKKLKFLTGNFREELRLDTCETCKGYIKTIDEQKTGDEAETIYLRENAASVYLDILADEKGFVKLLPPFQEVQITFLDETDDQ